MADKGRCKTCEGDYPMYGVAPHDCYWRKGPDFKIGQSTLLPTTVWAERCYVPDIEEGDSWSDIGYPSGCGIYYCPDCQREQYEAAWERVVGLHGEPPKTIAALDAHRSQDKE